MSKKTAPPPPPAALQVVHVETTLQTVFGVLEESGNILRLPPVGLSTQQLSEAALAAALLALQQQARRIAQEIGADVPDSFAALPD